MRMIQTFWTAGRAPLQYGFGWPHPEYNLMSWALSCLSLREHYEEVELYTDSVGRHVLIDLLGLPYTKVHVVLDDFQCLPHHWALAKIKTYSMQTEPFIHVDGDVYLPKPLPKEILEAPLVAQNREIGTKYYRRMVDTGILCYPTINIPEYMQEVVTAKSIPSYNAGFLGGSDLEFIQTYCDKVFRFMDDNRMNDVESPHNQANCNVYFEQIFFAVLTERAHKRVTTVYEQTMRDNGYCSAEFCNLDRFTQQAFFHILGGHKRNKSVMAALRRALLRFYPETYLRVLNLFPDKNFMISQNSKGIEDALMGAYPRECWDDMRRMVNEWKNVNVPNLVEWERRIAENTVLQESKEKTKERIIKCNPWLHICAIPTIQDREHLSTIKKRLKCSLTSPLKGVVLVPSSTEIGYEESELTDIGSYVLPFLLHGECTLSDLCEYLINLFHITTETDTRVIKEVILSELLFMQNRSIVLLI